MNVATHSKKLSAVAVYPCRLPLPSPLPSTFAVYHCRLPLPSPLPSAFAVYLCVSVAVAFAVYPCRLALPSPLPSTFAVYHCRVPLPSTVCTVFTPGRAGTGRGGAGWPYWNTAKVDGKGDGKARRHG